MDTFPKVTTAWRIVLAVLATPVAVGGCASTGSSDDGYNAFLQAIAVQCKPLIIGNDDIGQAIQFNGLGAKPENYNNFLAKTSALYAGGISPTLYRDSLTSFLGGGSYNKASFDCIIARVPARPGQAPAK